MTAEAAPAAIEKPIDAPAEPPVEHKPAKAAAE
jgi:hypothetical protein